MKIEKETAFTVSRELSSAFILANSFESSSNFEQNSSSFLSPAGFDGSPLEPYLTNTDKSPSNRGQKSSDFTDFSLKLYFETMKLYRSDKKVLQTFHRRGWQTLKLINENTAVLYTPFNPAGNSRAGWSLAQNNSNTDKARLASKQAAFEKALANVELWEYFATFTLDKNKQDRFDFKKSRDHIVKFLQNRGVKYFLVPERHKNGAWHYHALLSVEMGAFLSEFDGKALKNSFIRASLAQGRQVRHCAAYTSSFGYNIIEPCRDKEKCTYYMTKYVLKTFDDENFVRVSRRRFFCSKGLKSPKIVMPDEIDLEEFQLQSLSSHTQKVYLKRFNPQIPLYSLIGKPG